jgi:hypothetical protein
MSITGISICKVHNNFLPIINLHSMVDKYILPLVVLMHLPYLLPSMVAICMVILLVQGHIAPIQPRCIVEDRYIPILEVQSCTPYHQHSGSDIQIMVLFHLPHSLLAMSIHPSVN